jgi:hypothetical protein
MSDSSPKSDPKRTLITLLSPREGWAGVLWSLAWLALLVDGCTESRGKPISFLLGVVSVIRAANPVRVASPGPSGKRRVGALTVPLTSLTVH